MTIHLVLSLLDQDLVLFDGPAVDCPPLPRPGDEIVHEQARVRIEGICHQYHPNRLEISLLA